MAILAIGTRLAEQANRFAADTGSGRLAWLAARYVARLGGEETVGKVGDDLTWLEHAPALLHGGLVPIEVGRRAAEAVQQHLLRAVPA
jgi:hypothetical protein